LIAAMEISPVERGLSSSADEPVAAWMEAGDAPPSHRRLVLVLVGELDRRTTEALAYSWRIPAQERRALHVAIDQEQVWRLADAWMGSRAPFRLYMVEDEGGIARTVRRIVEYELDGGFDEVVVLVGRVAFRHWWSRALHDRTADAVLSVLTGLPGVVPTLMTVATV
jgi:hypothetical protein